VPILRGLCRSRTDADGMVEIIEEPQPFCGMFRWGSRHHGGSEQGGHPCKGKINRNEYQSSVRTSLQSVHHEGTEPGVSLFLHAKILVRLSCKGARDLPGRIRYAG